VLFRFCLYGFLKNQQYYEPFLLLALLEKGLSFTMIGLLIGFREICVNLMEVPTGALADVLGRRRAMIFSHLAYIVSFVIFAVSQRAGPLFAAMGFFAVGEAFRTGTHKAIIFHWLERSGREDEKTRIYGLTRSWSQMGSAVSVIVAVAIVFATRRYSWVFLLCVGPYLANVVNFLTYPTWLDGHRGALAPRGPAQVVRTLGRSLADVVRARTLRRLLMESMGFEGAYKVCKDYLQPIAQTAVLSLAVLAAMDAHRATAIAIGAVYFPLFVLGSFAARHADAFARRAGGAERGARALWVVYLGASVVIAAGATAGLVALVAAAFVALAVAQNFWRPILIGRIADQADPSRTATILSIESQAKSLFAAFIAPLLGLAVDNLPRLADVLSSGWGRAIETTPTAQFGPVGLVGAAIAAVAVLSSRHNARPSR